jgi:hypothetical protein
MDATTAKRCLSDLPLSQLLVALDDAERTLGPDSPTAVALARAVREKLRRDVPEPAPRRRTAGRRAS